MNAAISTLTHGQRVPIARDRWVENTRTGRLALVPDANRTGRWGAAPRPTPPISSSGAR